MTDDSAICFAVFAKAKIDSNQETDEHKKTSGGKGGRFFFGPSSIFMYFLRLCRDTGAPMRARAYCAKLVQRARVAFVCV